jgi:hypothetical protein
MKMVNPKPGRNKERARSSAKTEPAKGREWRTKILKEVQTSDGVKWRAQLSIAPDGTKFAGIRKVAIKKDGTEVMTRDGLAFKYSSSLSDEVEVILGLLSALAKPGPKKSGPDDAAFMLVHKVNKRPLTGSKEGAGTTASRKPALIFSSAVEAKEYRSTLDNGDDFKVKRNG